MRPFGIVFSRQFRVGFAVAVYGPLGGSLHVDRICGSTFCREFSALRTGCAQSGAEWSTQLPRDLRPLYRTLVSGLVLDCCWWMQFAPFVAFAAALLLHVRSLVNSGPEDARREGHATCGSTPDVVVLRTPVGLSSSYARWKPVATVP